MQNVLPLGGKASMGASAVVATELKAFNAYKADLASVGVVNSNERAQALRAVLLKHASPKRAKAFREVFSSLGLQA